MNQIFEVQYVDWEGNDDVKSFPTLEEAEEYKNYLLDSEVVIYDNDIQIIAIPEL